MRHPRQVLERTADPRRGLGLRLPHHGQLPRGLHRIHPAQDRGRRRATADPHGARRRLRAARDPTVTRLAGGDVRRGRAWLRGFSLRTRVGLLAAVGSVSRSADLGRRLPDRARAAAARSVDDDPAQAGHGRGEQSAEPTRSGSRRCRRRRWVPPTSGSRSSRADGYVSASARRQPRSRRRSARRSGQSRAARSGERAHRGDGRAEYRVVAVPAGRGPRARPRPVPRRHRAACPGWDSSCSSSARAGSRAAAYAGVAVARTGLRPVERLTVAAEHVARTERAATHRGAGRRRARPARSAFNSMLSALAASRDRQRALIADAGHELRTPLTSLRTNLDLLAQSEARPGLSRVDRAELLADVRAQVAELSDLVGDLVELSREDPPSRRARARGPRRRRRPARSSGYPAGPRRAVRHRAQPGLLSATRRHSNGR